MPEQHCTAKLEQWQMVTCPLESSLETSKSICWVHTTASPLCSMLSFHHTQQLLVTMMPKH